MGRYVIVSKIGEGGMGTVFAAYDPELDRRVAIKLLHGGTAAPDSWRHVRLLREAQAMARLSHPNVVTVHDVGEHESSVFIAMEFVEGKDLRRWLEDYGPEWREVVKVFIAAGKGLAAAHAAELVHRDFKPENVLLGRDGRLRVADFGLARADLADTPAVDDGVRKAASGALSLEVTRMGALVGTPAYMAPELLLGDPAGAASDQFAFCVSLFEALFGRRPFLGETLPALSLAITSGKITPPERGPRVPAGVRAIVEQGLRPRAEDRWASMAELVEALEGQLRRRRWWLPVAALAGLAVLPVLDSEEASPCEGAAQHLEGVWDDARRSEIGAAFSATEKSFAEFAWTQAEQRLTEYAGAWVEARTEACEATHVHHEQSTVRLDQRMQCLDQRLAALRAATDVFVAADLGVVEHAAAVVEGLPPITSCADTAYLDARVKPPNDPRVAEQVTQLETRVEQVAALHAAAQYEPALEAIEALAEEAEGLGVAPLQVRIDIEHGRVLQDLSRYTEAEALFERAYFSARRLGMDDMVVRAGTQLAWLVGNHLARHEAALGWLRHAQADAERLADEEAQAELMTVRGQILIALGRPDEAIAQLQRALDLQEQLLAPGDPSNWNTHHELALGLSAAGRYEEALVHARHSLELAVEAFGPHHPEVATVHDNLGGLLHAMGRFDRSLEAYRRGLQIRRDTFGDRHEMVGLSRNNIAEVLKTQGRYEEALAEYQAGRDILEAALEGDHPYLGNAIHNLGSMNESLGSYDQALRHHEEALAMRRRLFGNEHPDVANSLAGIGNVLQAHGKLDEAIEAHREALRIREAILGLHHPDLVYSLNNVAVALAAAGRLDEVVDLFERSIEILEKSKGEDHPDLGILYSNLAQIHVQQGRYAEARQTFDQSISRIEGSVGEDHPTLVGPLVGLSRVLLEAGDSPGGVEAAERALRIADAQPMEPIFPANARWMLAQALVAAAVDEDRAVELAREAHRRYAEIEGQDSGKSREVATWLRRRGVEP